MLSKRSDQANNKSYSESANVGPYFGWSRYLEMLEMLKEHLQAKNMSINDYLGTLLDLNCIKNGL